MMASLARNLQRPKSPNFRAPPLPKKIFFGLISRCRILGRKPCRYSSAPATVSEIWSASRSDSAL